MRDKILVFIPMYNCEKQIPRVLEQLKGEISKYITEVIVVNNISTDNGEEIAIEAIKNADFPFTAKVLRNVENYGLGGSHKVAFQYAVKNEFDYVIVLHGDDQGSIADLLPVIKSGKHRKVDCCLGGRFLPQSKLPGYSKFRIFGNHVFNVIFSISVGKKIYDLGAGLNMYKVSMLKNNFYHRYPDNLTFNCYMLFALKQYNQSHFYFPILWREEDQISNVKMTKQAWQTFKMAVAFFIGGESFLRKDARAKKIKRYRSNVVFDNSEK